MSANTVLLDELEESLLRNLASSTGNILDNEELIGTLESAKSKSVEISAKLAESEVTKIDINKTRAAYAPAAKRGSILFFAMAGRAWGGRGVLPAGMPPTRCLLPVLRPLLPLPAAVSNIMKMYEISLSSFLLVFKRALISGERGGHSLPAASEHAAHRCLPLPLQLQPRRARRSSCASRT